jgi:hypothetical protein
MRNIMMSETTKAPENGKKWYASKTLWLNVAGTAAAVAGVPIDPMTMAIAMGAANVGMRTITSKPVTF